MATISIKEAQATLSHLIHRLSLGDEVVITENDQPVARLSPISSPTAPRKIPRLGTLRGTVLSMDRFDDPLEDFKGHME